MESLPYDILNLICNFLSARDIGRLVTKRLDFRCHANYANCEILQCEIDRTENGVYIEFEESGEKILLRNIINFRDPITQHENGILLIPEYFFPSRYIRVCYTECSQLTFKERFVDFYTAFVIYSKRQPKELRRLMREYYSSLARKISIRGGEESTDYILRFLIKISMEKNPDKSLGHSGMQGVRYLVSKGNSDIQQYLSKFEEIIGFKLK